MADILFIKTSSLGDVIHNMPAITDVRRALPDARIAWLVEEAYVPLVALHPHVDDVISVAARRWRRAVGRRSTWTELLGFVRGLREHTYDTVIDTQGLIRTSLMTRIARGRRHGYDLASVREPLASFAYDVRHRVARDQHAILRNRALAGLALGYVAPEAIDFGLRRMQLRDATSAPYGVLLHSTARPEKEWPETHWIELGNALATRGPGLLLPWGSQSEYARSVRLAEQITGARVPQSRPLDGMARLIAGASFVVGVDTGLLHLAAALAVPLVSIFVASEPGLTGPLGAGPTRVVGGKGMTPSVDDVLSALRSILNGSAS